MTDRRHLVPDQVVRVLPDYHERYGGLWLVLREVDADYVTGVILMVGEGQTIIRLPRMGVETQARVFMKNGSS